MDLLLTREYWPGGTNGRLFWKKEFVSYTLEPPASYFRLDTSCIPEKHYELCLDQSVDPAAPVLLKACGKWKIPLCLRPELGIELGMQQIVLAAAITDEGRGVPNPKAFEMLKNRIGQLHRKGEKVLLEIRSYPEQALNLTYHQIAWMD
ncbi:hypothetical protein GCM10009119_19240 [Algoriphagus jejuensis]|uniref:DUF5675 domain-containing protein n=1 Tax=Algoriphagus jejuensis TaxID=419934 RepID=A0ABN1MZR6_9BACT